MMAKLKLKHRILCVGIFVFLTLTFPLFLSLKNLLDTSMSGDAKAPLRPVQRELLNGADSESSTGDFNSLVEKLVQSLDGLSRDVPADTDKSKAFKRDEPDDYRQVAKKLLGSKTFNSSDTIRKYLGVGRVLEEYVNARPQGTGPREEFRHDVGGDEQARPSQGLVDAGGTRYLGVVSPDTPFPVHYLDPGIVLTLQKYIKQHYIDHMDAKSKVKAPLSYTLHKGSNLRPWELWQNRINQHSVYMDTDPAINMLMSSLSRGDIQGMSTMADYGTQIKMIFKMADGSQALFKPMRLARNQERNPNWYYFDDFERHHAEIAAFHLDRIMQFYRVPPNTGRFINITTTIEPYASKSFKKTIFTSPAGNRCFYGKCDYYCDSGHAVCGSPAQRDVVEGSMAAWLPFSKAFSKKGWENPWRRSYSKYRRAAWEDDPRYCDKIKKTSPYNYGRRLLDLMDITIFDFIAANQDRHHYHTFKWFGNVTSPVLYDNGRGFGWIYFDDPSILVPVVQCCTVRYSTLRKLLVFHTGSKKLSDRMRESLSHDLLSSGRNGPVLSEGHLTALDRRVSKTLEVVNKCINTYGYESVVKDDGF